MAYFGDIFCKYGVWGWSELFSNSIIGISLAIYKGEKAYAWETAKKI